MPCREGSVDPEMRSAKRTTLCRALQSWFEELPYHTEFTQNAYLSHVLEGHLSALHSCQIFRKPLKIIVSSTLKKHHSRLYGGTGLSSFHCIMFLNEKVTLLFVIGFLCFELHCVYTWCFLFLLLIISMVNYIWLNIIFKDSCAILCFEEP